MTHTNSTPDNPAQVTDALIQAKDWISENIREGDIAGCTLLGKLAELTAAIGAGGQAVADARSIAEIIDPHSFMDIPFTDDPVLLDMVEQSKKDAIRKAERILSALTHPAPSGQAVAKDWDIETTADKIARQLAAEVKSFGPTGRIHGETYNAAKAGAIAAFECAVATLSAVALADGGRDDGR